MEFIIGIAALLVGGVSVFAYLKNVKKWVNIKNIPEEEIARAADKIIGEKIEQAEKEIERNKKDSENRLRQMRRETQEHEELLINREKKLNERTRMLDEKGEELGNSIENVKKMQK